MKILTTRPKYDGDQTVQMLIDAGFEANNHPFLECEFLKFNCNPHQNFQGYIFTSKNAIRSVIHANLSLDLPCYVVGIGTGSTAEKAGFTDIIKAGDDVQALIALLKQESSSQHLLYFRGEIVTHDLSSIKWVHQIEDVIMYRTNKMTCWNDDLTTDFLSGIYTHIVFASMRTLKAFNESIESHPDQKSVQNTLSRTTILCFGNPMLEYAYNLKAARYVVLPEPNIQGLLNILKEEEREYGKHI